VLRLRIQQALEPLTRSVATIERILDPTHAAPAVTTILPRSCSRQLTAVVELLHIVSIPLEWEVLFTASTDPPELHLLNGIRVARMQTEVAIAELQEGMISYQRAHEEVLRQRHRP